MRHASFLRSQIHSKIGAGDEMKEGYRNGLFLSAEVTH